MNKQSKKLIIMLLLLVIVAAGFYFMKNQNKEEVTEEEGEEIVILDVNQEDITRIDIVGSYALEKEGDIWYLVGDHAVEINQNYVSNMLRKIGPLTAKDILDGVEDYSQYGLTDASTKVSFIANGTEYSYYLGDYNSTANVSYIRIEGDPSVYAVFQGTVTAFQRSLDDMKK